MACTQFESIKQPTMNQVCYELSEALRLETSTYTISPVITEESCVPFHGVKAR